MLIPSRKPKPSPVVHRIEYQAPFRHQHPRTLATQGRFFVVAASGEGMHCKSSPDPSVFACKGEAHRLRVSLHLRGSMRRHPSRLCRAAEGGGDAARCRRTSAQRGCRVSIGEHWSDVQDARAGSRRQGGRFSRKRESHGVHLRAQLKSAPFVSQIGRSKKGTTIPGTRHQVIHVLELQVQSTRTEIYMACPPAVSSTLIFLG